jgi:hypothetical protein
VPFEKFTRRLIPLGKEPTVTMQSRGSLTLNLSAFQLIGSPLAVHLLYDRDERIIGIRAADPKDEDAYPPRTLPRRGEGGPRIVTAQAFASHYGIDTTPRRYRATLEDDILCIDLKQPQMPTGSKPTGSNQNGRAKRGNGATGSG